VTVIGDGAVGLSAVLAAKRLGAERIILMGRHKGPHRPSERGGIASQQAVAARAHHAALNIESAAPGRSRTRCVGPC
jgi:threonine dehydrogenase-like Zn-dependent dehydrogenase